MTDQTRAILRAALTAALLLLGGLALLVSVLFGVSQPADLPEARTEGTNGQPLAVCSIEDLPGLSTVRYANYTPDEFLQPHSLAGGEVLDLTTSPVPLGAGNAAICFSQSRPLRRALQRKERGTLPLSRRRLLLALHPLPAALFRRGERVHPRLVRDLLGRDRRYDFVNYSEYVGKTEEHRTVSEPLLLDLTFYSQRHIMSPDLSIRAPP